MSRPGVDRPSASTTAESRDAWRLAVALAALAGWIDVTGYLQFKLFVSFMSGNSTQAAAAAGGDWRIVSEAGRAIGVFVCGVVLGELVAPAGGRFARPLVLMLEAILLWVAVAFHDADERWVASLLGLAMGLQNASVHHAGGINVALTYVTGTLVHVGRSIAQALLGTGTWRAVQPFAMLWFALVSGGLTGAAVARRSPAAALLAGAVAATLMAAWTARESARSGPGVNKAKV